MRRRNNLSSSQSKVLTLILNSESPLTQKEILKETGLSLRTVKYALRFLTGEKLVTEQIDWQDIRMKKYGGKKNGRWNIV